MKADGTELPGVARRTQRHSVRASHPTPAPRARQRASEPAFKDPTIAAVMQHSYSTILGSVAVGDLDHTGKQEVVFADMAGYIYAYEASTSYCAALGQSAPCLRPGFPVHENFAILAPGRRPRLQP